MKNSNIVCCIIISGLFSVCLRMRLRMQVVRNLQLKLVSINIKWRCPVVSHNRMREMREHRDYVSITQLVDLGGRARRNSFVFAYIFTEKRPRRRSTPPKGSTPPTGNPGSASEYPVKKTGIFSRIN